ncbi:MAG: Hsp70 family protein, partial [Persicimonas sp.]
MIQRPIGIDLGTTNSAAAMMRPEGDDILLYRDHLERKTFPSMVGWDPDDERFITGYEAWNRRVMEPRPVASIKRKMGTKTEVDVGPQRLTPEEVSAKILEDLATHLQEFVAERADSYRLETSGAVITVPAYFDAPQIEATRRAGELAGLEVLGLLQEPTAAAMYHAWKHGIGDGNFLVYDLGGGTFDVSVIRSLMGEYQVLAIDGDNYLGGDDFDRRLAEEFRRRLVDRGYELDFDIADNDRDRVRFELLTRVAREVKEALSASEFQYVGRRDLFEDDQGEAVTLDFEIGRAEFEELVDDLVDQSLVACERALEQSAEQADVTLADIDHVLLVGGSTRIPLVQRRVTERLCGADGAKADAPLIDEPDTCVALGAAIQAANRGGVTFVDEATDHPDCRLTITSPLSTRDDKGRIAARLDGECPQAESTALVGPGDNVVARAQVRRRDDGAHVDLDGIELARNGRHDFRLAFRDEGGDELVGFDIFLTRMSAEEPYRPTGTALSNPTVLAKDIYLEIARDGEPDRYLLLSRGTSLPTRETFEFHTGDRSGAVLLRLYQSRYPIRTIHLDVPDETEVGTPVELSLEVDEAMNMVATGEVDGQTFWASIEPPPARKMRDWDEIEELLERAEEVRKVLWGIEEKLFAKKVDPVVAGIRETARTDPDKLQVLARRLEGILEDYRREDTDLTPAYSRYKTLLNAIKRVVFRGARDEPLGRTLEEWQDHLADIEREADAAWRKRDQKAWSRAFNQIQASWESLAQEEYRFTSTDSPEYVERLYTGLQRRVGELKKRLDDFTLSSKPETEKLQRREIMRLKSEVEDRVEQPLGELDPSGPTEKIKPELARLSEV